MAEAAEARRARRWEAEAAAAASVAARGGPRGPPASRSSSVGGGRAPSPGRGRAPFASGGFPGRQVEGGGGGFLLLDGPRCRSLCTARACCQMFQLLCSLLILICSSVSYNNAGGYTGIFSLGDVHYYEYGGAYSGLSGADGERAQRLDAQFHQLRRPPAQAAMAVGGSLMAFTCLQVGAGLLRIPWRCPAWLVAEVFLDVAIAIGLAPALYFFYQKLHSIYASSLCQEREQLYSSKGYQGFGCGIHGAEVAVGLFGVADSVAFLFTAFLAVRAFRTIRNLKAKPADADEL